MVAKDRACQYACDRAYQNRIVNRRGVFSWCEQLNGRRNDQRHENSHRAPTCSGRKSDYRSQKKNDRGHPANVNGTNEQLP